MSGDKNKDKIRAYMDSVKQAESSGNPNAESKTSSAKGLYQFTDSTWKEMEKKIGRKLNIKKVEDQEAAMRKFTELNAEVLEKNGFEVNQNNLYLVHHFGASGGINFLKKLQDNPNELASNYMSSGAVKANGALFTNKDKKPITAAELYNKLSEKMGANSGEMPQKAPQEYQEFPIPEGEIVNENNIETPVEEENNNQKPNTATADANANNNHTNLRLKKLTSILDEKKTVDNTRKDLNLTSGGLDLLPEDLGLIEEEETDQAQESSEREIGQFKLGGGFNGNFKNESEGLNEFNEGGTHEQNIHGGIPQGISKEGILNTVEEGETKLNDYVYTNSLKVNSQSVIDSRLPDNIIGMTFAEASKFINKEIEKNPFDKIVKKTANDQLDRLMLENEKARMEKEKLDINQSMINEEDGFNETKQFFLGGNQEQATSPWMSGIAPAMGGIQSLIAGDKEGAKKGGLTAATAVTGAAIGGPLGGMIGSTVGNIAGDLLFSKDNDGEEETKAGIRVNNQFKDNYKMGGKINRYDGGGRLNPRTGEWEYEEGTISDNFMTSSLADQYYGRNTPQITLNDNELNDTNTEGYKPSDYGLNQNKYPSSKDKQEPKDYKPKGINAMQYAPILGSALNYLDDKKDNPDSEVLNTLNNRYTYKSVDENRLVKEANQASNNTINSLSQSGASQGQLRANITGANLGRIQGISDSFMKAEDTNRGYADTKQKFDLGVDQFNIGQNNQQREINAGNKAAYEDRLRASRNALFANIGSVGKEGTYNNRLKNMTQGYDSQGIYITPDLWDRLFGAKEEANVGKYGGFFSSFEDALNEEEKYQKKLNNI